MPGGHTEQQIERPMADNPLMRANAFVRHAEVRLHCARVSEYEVKQLTSDLEAIAAERFGRIVLDLSQVALVTSAGVSMLIQLHKSCGACGGRMVLFGLNDDLVRMLKIAGLLKLLSVEKDRARAVKRVL